MLNIPFIGPYKKIFHWEVIADPSQKIDAFRRLYPDRDSPISG